jgi:tRNA threonylcarbamoyladenosine biosynthesis protein TsaB
VTRLLAIESATGAVGVAVSEDGRVVAELTVHTARRHVELLHPAIEEVCSLAGVRLGDLAAVGVDVGPGLFTGIRVGVSAAKAIALALDLPAVGVTSLEALEAAARAVVPADGVVVPVVDLRRGEVGWSVGGQVGWGRPERLVEQLAAAPGGGEGPAAPVVLAGDGALRYRELFEARPGGAASWRVAGTLLATPPVACVAVLACAALSEGREVDAARLAPCYLREADARINWTTRHDRPQEGR